MRRFVFFLAMFLFVSPLYAAEKFEQLSVTSGAVVSFTASKIVYNGPVGWVNASSAYCTVETGALRVTFDGTTPSSTVGHLIATSSWFQLTGFNQIQNFKSIAPSTTGVLTCTYSFD
jgi:hypothetical protein